MMKLSCKDIKPDTSCDFEARGNDATEVARKIMAHAKAEHPEDVKGMSDSDMMKMFESKAHA